MFVMTVFDLEESQRPINEIFDRRRSLTYLQKLILIKERESLFSLPITDERNIVKLFQMKLQ